MKKSEGGVGGICPVSSKVKLEAKVWTKSSALDIDIDIDILYWQYTLNFMCKFKQKKKLEMPSPLSRGFS